MLLLSEKEASSTYVPAPKDFTSTIPPRGNSNNVKLTKGCKLAYYMKLITNDHGFNRTKLFKRRGTVILNKEAKIFIFLNNFRLLP